MLRTRGRSVQQLQHVSKGAHTDRLDMAMHAADPADPAGSSVQVGFRGVHTSFTATIMEPTMT